MMSIVNLGLQSIGLMRKEMSSEAEKALKNCNSLKQLRSAGEPFRQEISLSIQQPIDLVADVLSRLQLKGKKFEVETGCSEFEEECFWEVLQQIEPSLSSDDTTREKIKDKEKLQAFLNHCVKFDTYTYCIKKCGKDDCSICKPIRMDKDKFSKFRFLPDPLWEVMITTCHLTRHILLLSLPRCIVLHYGVRELQTLFLSDLVYNMHSILESQYNVRNVTCGVLCSQKKTDCSATFYTAVHS